MIRYPTLKPQMPNYLANPLIDNTFGSLVVNFKEDIASTYPYIKLKYI